jgi:hypothetical protein
MSMPPMAMPPMAMAIDVCADAAAPTAPAHGCLQLFACRFLFSQIRT